MSSVTLNQIGKSYGSLEVVSGINLDIADKEFIVLVGPSGCGKTTLLRMIAGLETITKGDLVIDGKRVNSVRPDERGLAMVFQSYALYPHMTVADNMSFALRLAGIDKMERERKVSEAAKILQLDHLLQRRPAQLSGGQRQRVAIGRAIVRDPKVFLFDEPLSNLDAALRIQMRIELARLHKQLSATMIYVTHDQVEAMTMADRIVVVNKGGIEQVGTPMEIYQNPDTVFVAGFIGSPKMNLFEATVDASNGGLSAVIESGQRIPLSTPLQAGTKITLGVRPEALDVDHNGPLAGEITVIEHLGGETFTYVDIGKGKLATIKSGEKSVGNVGDTIRISFEPSRLHVFGPDGRAIRTQSRH
ncbi:ATPase component of ABC-type sugar transporter [Rhizobium leguminosarum bv. trifolii WSM597]|uniref:ATPase component of ABC-type sugar transporter n=1 Tax=Rhizobium leguminosarum bv. trifolii WSM597 TaxID=754764 RepID=I9NK42_RHILT|nr:sn-glycerol-3-phosphate ABC transporter ATP-binding protein UgpC [Rhizobium leguminosarum]EJB07127.1 ATPase component of ABC-type sugar transporter [Rhizobium leguminosarum bv. trifolii WSM597]